MYSDRKVYILASVATSPGIDHKMHQKSGFQLFFCPCKTVCSMIAGEESSMTPYVQLVGQDDQLLFWNEVYTKLPSNESHCWAGCCVSSSFLTHLLWPEILAMDFKNKFQDKKSGRFTGNNLSWLGGTTKTMKKKLHA